LGAEETHAARARPSDSDGSQPLSLLSTVYLDCLIEARKIAEGVEAKTEPERLEATEAAPGAWPAPVSVGGVGPVSMSDTDRIQLHNRASFHSPAAFCATWVHEQIHSTGHESRLKRGQGSAFSKPRYP
jgi:antirestriction protein ArdC